MPFKTDKQRKAVMAKIKEGRVKSEVNPKMMNNPNGIRKIKRKLAEIQEKRRLKIEQKGRERIAKEKKQLEQETETAKRLAEEAEVELARERIKAKKRKALGEMKEIERARRERRLAPFKRAYQKAKKGLEKLD